MGYVEELFGKKGMTLEEFDGVEVAETDREKMHAITPTGGRYRRYVEGFRKITSEFEWTKRRVKFEVDHLLGLSKRGVLSLGEEEKEKLKGLYIDFSEKDFKQIQFADRKIHHDIVAMTVWMTRRVGELGFGEELQKEVYNCIHFGLTSADVNTNVYGSILNDLVREEYLPVLLDLQKELIRKVEIIEEGRAIAQELDGASDVLAGQTHGQFAEFTTVGKMYANFVDGIDMTLREFVENGEIVRAEGKLGGAVGNNSDLKGAFPEVDWLEYGRELVDSWGLDYQPMCDQDSFNIKNNRIFGMINRVNDVLLKYCDDFWEYQSRGVLRKVPKATSSGSSVMAQKVNPWRTEGGWELIEEADFTLRNVYNRLSRYKRQGDLRRSIRKRFIGEPFAKLVIGMKRVLDDLKSYNPCFEAIQAEVDEQAAMASGYMQTVLKRFGKLGAYDMVKEETMGKRVTWGAQRGMVEALHEKGELSGEQRDEMLDGMRPENNVGYARRLAVEAVGRAQKTVKQVEGLLG